jgi:NADPH:quinone reductase-like Zn-dependent oxidoreductase
MVTQAMLTGGERVMIHAVASGVGLAATQIARAWEAVPFGTTRTASKLDAARREGLEDGIVVDRDLEPLGPAVEKWTGGQGMNVTLDLVGGPYFLASVKAAALKGRVLIVGSLAGATADFPLGVVLRKRIRIIGTALRSRSLDEKIDATRRFAEEIVPLFPAGKLRPVIDSMFPLDQIADAHRRMESNQTVGKIVLTL